MTEIIVKTSRKRQVLDITDQVHRQLKPGQTGAVCLMLAHTTAALTVADLDPGTDLDILDALEKMVPDIKWRHAHDPTHTPDHVLSALVGPSLILPAEDGNPCLGSWQRLVLLEFDGPRERSLSLMFLPESGL